MRYYKIKRRIILWLVDNVLDGFPISINYLNHKDNIKIDLFWLKSNQRIIIDWDKQEVGKIKR